jgi:hypothetical protein
VWPFFHGLDANNGEPIHLNGVFHVSLTILQFVVASAGEAKLGTLCHNCLTGNIFRLALEETGHKQPQPLVHCNDAMAVGIANNFIKRQYLCLMEIHFFGLDIKLHKICMNSAGTPGKRIW